MSKSHFFLNWKQYLFLFILGFILCTLFSGLLHYWGCLDQYSTQDERFHINRKTLRKIFPVNSYKAIISINPENIGDFLPIYEVAQGIRIDPDFHMYQAEQLRAHRSSFVYTPFAALLISPFVKAGMTLYQTASVIKIINQLLWFASFVMLMRIVFYNHSITLPLALLFALHYLLFYPLARSLELTQAGVWIFFFLVLAAFLLQSHRHIAAGLTLAFGVSIKPHLGLMVIPLAVTPQFPKKMLGACLAGIFIAAVASLIYAGLDNCFDYISYALPTLSSGYAFYPNKSINGLLLRLFTLEDPSVYNLALPVPWIKICSLLFGIFMLCLAMLYCRNCININKNEDNVFCYTFCLVIITVASPICWEHHLAALLIAFSVVVKTLWNNPWLRNPTLEVLLFISILAVGCYYDGQCLSGFPKGLFSGIELYGALLLIGCMMWILLRIKKQLIGS